MITQADHDLLIKMLTEHEGFRQYPYKCTAGMLTIGIGRNLEARGISKLEAHFLLLNDIDNEIDALKARLPFFKSLDPIRQVVLVDMSFNLGIAGLLKFKNTLSLIEQGKYSAAATEMLNSRWAQQVGRRAKRLSRMMETGRYQELGL